MKAAHDALQELAAEVVFMGGAPVAFYADRPAGEACSTDKVDILAEWAHHRGYAAIEEKRRNGFTTPVSLVLFRKHHLR